MSHTSSRASSRVSDSTVQLFTPIACVPQAARTAMDRALSSRWVAEAADALGNAAEPPPRCYADFQYELRRRGMTMRDARGILQPQGAHGALKGPLKGRGEAGRDDGRDEGILGVRPPALPDRSVARVDEQRAARARRVAEPRVQRMLEKRRKLPVYLRREEVLRAALGASQVAVVGGETGSGKTTQVPQFLLDELLDNDDCAGGEIVVTQPRRLAAIAVAMRVADERGERVGDSVGYAVRLENMRATAPCKITFCTTGILLRRMSGAGGVDGVVHVVIDEVHERDLNTDFLLVLVARLVRVAPNLRVTLMSATLDAGLFADYFQHALRRVDGHAAVPVPKLEVKVRAEKRGVRL